VNGVQFGIVNIGRRVSGAQVGIINIAEEVDGTSVGLISLAKNGRVQPVAWASNNMPVNAGVKFIVGPMYSQFGAGYSPSKERYRLEGGIGGHVRLSRWNADQRNASLFFEPAIHFASTYDAGASEARRNDFIYRGAVGYDFGIVSLFAGAGLVHEVTSPDPLEAEYFGGVSFF
jgi:hypothetical protein